MFHIFTFVLLIAALVLFFLDNDYGFVVLFLSGIIYAYIGWSAEKGSRDSIYYFVIGMFICSILFAAEFVVGQIQKDTISIYEERTSLGKDS